MNIFFSPAFAQVTLDIFSTKRIWNKKGISLFDVFPCYLISSLFINEWYAVLWFQISVIYFVDGSYTPNFQVGTSAAIQIVKKMHIICAIPVLSPCARDVLRMQLYYVLEETKAFVKPALKLWWWLKIMHKKIRFYLVLMIFLFLLDVVVTDIDQFNSLKQIIIWSCKTLYAIAKQIVRKRLKEILNRRTILFLRDVDLLYIYIPSFLFSLFFSLNISNYIPFYKFAFFKNLVDWFLDKSAAWEGFKNCVFRWFFWTWYVDIQRQFDSSLTFYPQVLS